MTEIELPDDRVTENEVNNMKQNDTDGEDGVVAVFLCENCGELLRSRFPEDPDNYYGPPVCGICGRGPTTRLYGASEPIRAVERGLSDEGMRALITACRPDRDGDSDWDFTIEVKVETSPD